MTNTEIVEENYRICERKTFTRCEGGHDWFHIQRVFRQFLYYPRRDEKKIIYFGSLAWVLLLLHDIAMLKFQQLAMKTVRA